MAIDRKVPTIADHPSDLTGLSFADEVQEEIGAIWALLGGILNAVSGTNTITATAPVTVLAYTDGLRFTLVPVANNTGNVQINIDSLGLKNLFDESGNPIPANTLVTGVRRTIEYDSGLAAFALVGGSGGGGGLASKVLVASHTATNGTAGGGATSGSWLIYPIETSILNDMSGEGVALSGSAAFTFGPVPAGTYDFFASVPFQQTGVSRIRLFNTTDSTVVATLASDTVRATGGNEVKSATLRGRFVISSAKSFRLEYRVGTTKATDGLGAPASFSETERYGHMMLVRPPEGSLGLGSIATHNLTISTLSPSGGNDGDIWFKVIP